MEMIRSLVTIYFAKKDHNEEAPASYHVLYIMPLNVDCTMQMQTIEA